MGCCRQKLPPICKVEHPKSLQMRKLLDGHFNCGVVEWRGRKILASRYGWVDSKVHIHDLDDDWRVRNNQALDIKHPEARSGAEDPRLFVWNDRVHVACNGYVHGNRTSLMIARLDEDLTVKRLWIPQYPARQVWEKNWAFFNDGQLRCVYSIYPYHTVLTFNGNCLSCVLKAEFSPGVLMRVNHLRGGAPPVLYNGEWYHWFHTIMTGRIKEYGLGLYTFSPASPYKPLRVSHKILLTTNDQVVGWNKRVVFPCGALLQGDKWVITYGKNDRECWMASVDVSEVESMLEKI